MTGTGPLRRPRRKRAGSRWSRSSLAIAIKPRASPGESLRSTTTITAITTTTTANTGMTTDVARRTHRLVFCSRRCWSGPRRSAPPRASSATAPRPPPSAAEARPGMTSGLRTASLGDLDPHNRHPIQPKGPSPTLSSGVPVNTHTLVEQALDLGIAGHRFECRDRPIAISEGQERFGQGEPDCPGSVGGIESQRPLQVCRSAPGIADAQPHEPNVGQDDRQPASTLFARLRKRLGCTFERPECRSSATPVPARLNRVRAAHPPGRGVLARP